MAQLRRKWLIPALLLVALAAFYQATSSSGANDYELASAADPIGLRPVDCWFGELRHGPATECYFMQVREDHADDQSRVISFPLLIFRAPQQSEPANPVLHLGSGGPGAANHLDGRQSIESILDAYDQLSVDIGRDLYIIDPRGTGLSTPLLTCDLYVDNELERLGRHLSLIEEWQSVDRDYIQCIEQFKQQGIDFNHYNSAAIVQDIEALRAAIGVDRWVLVGVSYAAVYAQFIARYYPATVEAMILDSPVFPAIKAHHNYVQRVLAPYEMLFKHCGDEDGCANDQESEQLQAEFWRLQRHLNLYPLEMRVVNPYTQTRIPVILNGERFLSAIAEGIYGKEIFTELKQVMQDLSTGSTRSIYPYVKSLLAYLLDRNYGDVSSDAHFCYEGKPFTDYDLMHQLTDELPAGYIRDTSKLSLDWPDQCDLMEIKAGSPELAQAVAIATPTLFLQGTLDAVTPLSDVEMQIANFSHSDLLTYDQSHDILGSSPCAQQMAGHFIQHKSVGDAAEVCQSVVAN